MPTTHAEERCRHINTQRTTSNSNQNESNQYDLSLQSITLNPKLITITIWPGGMREAAYNLKEQEIDIPSSHRQLFRARLHDPIGLNPVHVQGFGDMVEQLLEG